MLRRLLLFLLATAGLNAEPGAGEAEVAAVMFSLVRPTGAAGRAWHEADLQLNVRPARGSPGQMLSRVRVVLTLACEVVGEGQKRLEFYRAEAETVALGAGRASVRFYLPPEIVQRDAVRGEPRYWSAEATVGGKTQPAGLARHSASLAEAAVRRSFAERAVAEAPANDGILLPQYLTPFATDYANDTPAFVRREAGR